MQRKRLGLALRPVAAGVLGGLVLTLAVFFTASPALAACDPNPAANNVSATCTGTTSDQGPEALTGYGAAAFNLNVNVMSGATIEGTNVGLRFATGTVSNFGTILTLPGGAFGIWGTTGATVNNANSIFGSDTAIYVSAGAASVTNSGAISGGAYGVYGATTSTVANTGTITGTTEAAVYGNVANVTNTGTLTGGNYGVFGNSTANVVNSGTVSGGIYSVFGNNAATVTNSGNIGGGQYGVASFTSTSVTNTGNISASLFAVYSQGDAFVNNSGSISGGTYGIWAHNVANVINTGVISGGTAGIDGSSVVNLINYGLVTGGQYGVFPGAGNITNFGTIEGGTYGIWGANGATSITNAGTIKGNTAAILLSAAADTLTLLPGSRIYGLIDMGGNAGDRIIIVGGNLSTVLTVANFTGTIGGDALRVVSGDRIATLDPTAFAAARATMVDFSRGVSGMVGERTGEPALQTSDATAFAAEPAAAPSPARDAFADIPSLSAYAADTMMFKNPTQTYADGSTVWARGFAGRRVQQADDMMLGTHNQYYGGAIGAEWQTRPDLKVGAFLGAGNTRSTIEANSGDSDSDLMFAGAFGRYAFGASFLSVALQGGHVRTDVTRNIFSNVAPGGVEAATASYSGWYMNPEATLGHTLALGSLAGAAYALTPTLQVRYLYGSFGGYTESGSSANLTVGHRSVSNFEERAQLKLTRTQIFAPTDMLMTHIYGGALGSQRVGSAMVDATLLGQALPFATPGDDQVWGGFAGAGLEWRSGRVGVFGSAEYLVLSDSSTVVSAQAGFRLAL